MQVFSFLRMVTETLTQFHSLPSFVVIAQHINLLSSFASENGFMHQYP